MTDLPTAGFRDSLPAAAVGSDRDYLIRSEEQLHVATERVVAGYARLEKFVVTETKTITVQVSHEEFRLVHDPVAEAGAEPRHPDRTEQKNTARWLYLSREEVVVTKRTVPVERVRLEVYPVTEPTTITDQVRKEQIDMQELADDLPPRA
ncbi:uncharacterized protein (TIGR02271 family) [Nakamurella sp. UYEF19]|uniref:YsnF/AvaK domain-containing protein n=1 Tax=Nakamurella sp. UYEF19 TaxID=1756392 RepID=UPI003392F145